MTAPAKDIQDTGGLRAGKITPITTAREKKRSQGWELDLHRENDRVAKSTANATRILRNHPEWAGVIGYDERADAPVLRRPPPVVASMHVGKDFPRQVVDADAVYLQAWMETTYDVTFAIEHLNAALDTVAKEHAYDPVKEYLVALKWDGTERLSGWLATYLGAEDDEYARGIGPKWMISAVARVLEPGCQVDHMLVLEGEQGSGKSSAVRRLAARPQWTTDSVGDMATKDAAEGLRGPWIVEMGELASLNRSDSQTIKAFLTRTHDRFRPAYARRSIDCPRRCVFIGTTNPEGGYLRDATGGRRFWPVRTSAIDVAAIDRDRDQLWAEAVHRFRAGEQWHPDAALAALAAGEAEGRFEVDEWEGAIAKWLVGREGEEIVIADVLRGALDVEIGSAGVREQKRVGASLHRLGWRKSENKVRREGRRLHVWTRRGGGL